MKLNFEQLKLCVGFILCIILINQAVWVSNMYTSYRFRLERSINQAIGEAILREVSDRSEQAGGWITYVPLAQSGDTARFITKTIRSADTSFQVTFDRFDPHSESKLLQFLLKDDIPVNVYTLDSIFRLELNKRNFPLSETYVEHIDLKSNQVIASNRSENTKINKDRFLSSSMTPIDIFHTMGVQAYARNTTFSILRMMIFQLILSVTLMLICIFFLFILIRTFFWKEKEESMRQESVNAMTHEFKRPISSAVAQASLIPYYLGKKKEDKIEQYADNIILELNKLTAYTERVQQLSNNSKARIVLHKEPIAIVPFFESMVVKYRTIDEKAIHITLNADLTTIHIHVDLLHFSNIIENLIENAIKYSGESLTIDISLKEEKGRLYIHIKDNGIGIAKADLNHIFDKYYRSKHNNVQQKAGFGLGLTYVKSMVEAHDGKIEVHSQLGAGSTFILYLAIKEDVA